VADVRDFTGSPDPSSLDQRSVRLPKPSKKHVEEATEYLRDWLRNSAEYVDAQIPKWKFCEDVVQNRRDLREFDYEVGSGVPDIRATNRAARRAAGRMAGSKRGDWHSNFVVSGAPLVSQYVEGVHDSIFAFDDYFHVIPRFIQQEPSTEDPNFPTSQKIEQALLTSFTRLGFTVRMWELLSDMATYGPCPGKVKWEDGWGGGPIIRPINPARFLPDRFARNSDPQLWDGVGERIPCSVEHVRHMFKVGVYDLNQDDFRDRLSNWTNYEADEAARIKEDRKAYDATAKSPGLMLWEWHGKLYFSDSVGPTECVATFVTGRQAKGPEDGVLIRLREAPIIITSIDQTTGYPTAWLRPFVLGHFSPGAGPFCPGIIELNRDKLYYLSSLVCQFIDSSRFQSVPMLAAREGSPALDAIDNTPDGDFIYPGKIWRFMDEGDIKALAFQGVALNDLASAIQMLDGYLQRDTAVVNIPAQQRISATEAAERAKKAAQPVNSRVKLIHAQVLQPFGDMALALFQRKAQPGTVMMQRDSVPAPAFLSAEEISTGDYEISWALNLDDQSRIARGQLLQNLFQAATANELPLLLLENMKVNRGAFIREILRLGHIPNSATIIEKAQQEEVTDRLMKIGPPDLLQRLGLLPPPPPPGAGDGSMPPEGGGSSPGPLPPPGQPPLEAAPEAQEPGTLGPPGALTEDDLQQIWAIAQAQGAIPPGFVGGG
jgi:hypothetical protein